MAVLALVPEEIISHEILLRLPVKSLVRFRCVCKSWNSLLYNSDYLSHLNRSIPQNPKKRDRDRDDDDDYLLLMNSYHGYDLSILSRIKLSETGIIDNNVPRPLSLSPMYTNLVGSVNGLVCMAICLEVEHQFILWNPMIRFSETILVPAHLKHDNFWFGYGFGWDSVTNDYKLLIICPIKTVVYSYNTKRWSNIKGISPGLYCCHHFDPCVIVNGCPYWRRWTGNSILKFDTRNNKCRSLNIRNNWDHYRLLNLNDCLALIDYYVRGTPTVYRFDEERKIWIRMYKLAKSMDYWKSNVYSFKYAGEIVFQDREHLHMYDSKSDKVKSYPRSGGRCPVKCRGPCHCEEHHRNVNGFSYTPSLVALQGMRALHL